MSLFKRLLLQLATGILGFYLAGYFLEEVGIKDTSNLFYAGITLGLINFFIRPLLRIVTFPLRILTLGLFTFFINIAIVWFVKASFAGITIESFLALIYTTLIIWVMEFTLQTFSK